MRFTEICDSEDFDRKLVVWSDKSKAWVCAGALLKRDFLSASLILYSDYIPRLREALDEYERDDDSDVPLYGDGYRAFRYAPLFSGVEKILCVGLNYAEHAEEFGDAVPEDPVVFCKASSSLNYCEGNIRLPAVSNRVDYEGELVVVIGSGGKNIPEDRALDHVAGYCCGNDVSARDWQKGKPAGQWFLGKSFDSFAPVGPFVATRDEIDDPHNLRIETRLNGEVVQSSNTSRMIYRIERLISYLSGVMTLKTGDLIFTGTPNGVGDARRPPRYLRDGDEVVVTIEKLGSLRSFVKRS